MVVLLFFFCLWLCFWVLPAILWERGRRLERRAQALAEKSCTECALAEERAAALLRDLLNEAERQQLMQHGYLDISSPGHAGRRYRIPGYPGRIRVFEHGRAVMDLCVHPISPLPANDVIAVHKLLIEGDEEDYLARANELPLTLLPELQGA